MIHMYCKLLKIVEGKELKRDKVKAKVIEKKLQIFTKGLCGRMVLMRIMVFRCPNRLGPC